MLLNITRFFMMSSLFAFAIGTSSANEYENTVGELELTDTNNQTQYALLMNTDISGAISGMLASITVRQSFQNQSDAWVNGRYVFPLSEGAAVDSLKIQIGERIIDGIVKEKEEAKKTFEQAKAQGKQAGLLEQHRPNLFSISVANIAPHEEIVATITYVDQVDFDNNQFSLRLPTTLTPRYIPGAPIKLSQEIEENIQQQLTEQSNVQINPNIGWATSTNSVPDADQITPIQIRPENEQTTHLFSLNLSLNSGLALQDVISDSHTITNTRVSDIETQISLSNTKELMDRDLVLTWQTTIGNTPQAAHFQQEFEGSFYSMLMVNPPKVDALLTLPRDVTFIIDSSGSMAGTSMTQAKQALHQGLSYLSSNDVFNIIDFDSRFTTLFKQSKTVNSRSIRQAKNMINGLNPDGGTEMMGALQYALDMNDNQSYLRQIVFITDGAIGNEQELFKLINNKLGDTRLFTVGIGSAPNSFFMNRAAKFGRGSYTYINNVDQVTEKMDALFKKITHPVLRDISIDWQQNVEQYPERVPDLYSGEPLVVLVKSDKPLDKITASGSLLQTPWTQSLSLSSNSPNTENIDAVWAREKVADLMDKLATAQLTQEQVKPNIVTLGISHNIVTKFTSFVAVDNTPVKPEHELAKHENVPNLMPHGSAMAIPQTATPATLFSLLGCLLILVGLLIQRYRLSLIAKTAVFLAAKQS